MFHKKGLWRGLTYVFAFLLAISILVMSILETFRASVDSALGTTSETLESEDDGTLYSAFTPSEELLKRDSDGKIIGADSDAFVKKQIELGRREVAEGAVLLKNNGALPLATGSNITLLGKRSYVPLLGSSGGATAVGSVIKLTTALEGDRTNFNKELVIGGTSGGGMGGGGNRPGGGGGWNPGGNTGGNAGGKTATKAALTAVPVDGAIDNTQEITAANGHNDYLFSELDLKGFEGQGAGAGFHVNPALQPIYDTLTASGAAFASSSNETPGTLTHMNEPSRTDLAAQNADYTSSFAQYGDAAIVTIGRASSESTDYLPGKVQAGYGITEPLQLTAGEKDIIKLAKENFSKVIVLLNTNSAMEVKELKDDNDIDAILWIGHLGNYGSLGLADVLCGRVSPSGGLYDIYATQNLSAPAMMNMGTYAFANAGTLDVTNSNNYLMEVEGIYVGYRYYETRYFDTVYAQGNADSNVGAYASQGGWNYNDEVTYGFGYGNTYTTFTQEIVGTPKLTATAHEMYMDFDVKVTNTGNYAAKSIVQIYGQAPYIKGGVEKSAIQLLAFDKTSTLQPQATETVSVKVDLQYIASYDNTWKNADGTKGCYILDEGKYYFAIGNGAHDALNNVLAKQGKTPANTSNKMDYEGKAALAYEWNYDYAGEGTVDYTTFGITKSNVQVSNQLDVADWNTYEGAEQVTYLSRSDWAGTYPKEYVNISFPESMRKQLNLLLYDLKTDEDTSSVTWDSADKDLKFYQLSKSDFDDPRWETLLNQLTLQDSMMLAYFGGTTLPDAPSVGIVKQQYTENTGNGIQSYTLGSKVIDENSPWRVPETDRNAKLSLKVFGSAPLVASSFNPELMYDMGDFIGDQALFVGLPILWGPGLNTHRHAYNGRNGEYYSEDPVLAGTCAMEFAIAARQKGLIAAPKHFAFNDQETNRQGIAPFMTEQRAREIELRAFQLPIEATKYTKFDDSYTLSGGMIGLMTSFSKIGTEECHSCYGLMTGILRSEWGFHGYAVTDINDNVNMYTAMVHAGTTGFDVRMNSNPQFSTLENSNQIDGIKLTTDVYKGDLTMMKALKTSNHNFIWALTQTNIMNYYNSTTHIVTHMTWWRAAYISAITITAVLTAAGSAMWVLSYLKTQKEEN